MPNAKKKIRVGSFTLDCFKLSDAAWPMSRHPSTRVPAPTQEMKELDVPVQSEGAMSFWWIWCKPELVVIILRHEPI
jgi:hypothetical protein